MSGVPSRRPSGRPSQDNSQHARRKIEPVNSRLESCSSKSPLETGDSPARSGVFLQTMSETSVSACRSPSTSSSTAGHAVAGAGAGYATRRRQPGERADRRAIEVSVDRVLGLACPSRSSGHSVDAQDQARAAVPGEVVPRPVEEHRQPVAEADEVHEVQAEPGQPGRRAAEAGCAAAARRPPAAGRSWPSCPCRGSGTAVVGRPSSRRTICAGGVAARLHRDRRELRAGTPAVAAVGDGGDVADGERVGPARDRAGRAPTSMRPPGRSARRASSASGLACTPAAHTSVWRGEHLAVGEA